MPTKRKQQSLETKERIIEQAMTLYKKSGYNNVKITDICKASGISIGGFYHHFKTKEDIINQVYIGFDAHLSDLLKDKEFPSCSSAILFIIENELNYSQKSGVQITLMIFQLQLTSLKKQIVDENRYINLSLEKYILNGISSGEFNSDINVKEIIQWILRTSRGVIYDWCLHEGNYDLVQAGLHDVAFIIDHLLK